MIYNNRRKQERNNSQLPQPSDLITWVLNLVEETEVLADSADTGKPTDNVHRSNLVVRAAPSGTTKRLLSDNSTSAFDIDVEVTCGVGQVFLSVCQSFLVLSENTPGEAIFRSGINILDDCLPLIVWIHIDSRNRTK